MHKAMVTAFAFAILTGAVTACAAGGSTGKTDVFNIVVTGDKSSVGDISAKKGDTIQMTITTDKDEEIHLHGYDIIFDCKAGQPLTKTFTADKTGQFEYEIEATSTHLGNLTVNP